MSLGRITSTSENRNGMSVANRNRLYRNSPLSEEAPKDSFYKYLSIVQCYDNCLEESVNIAKCRTIGILHSENGKFYLRALESNLRIRLSMVYLKSPVKSTLVPYAVQVFGDLQWRNRPVIFLRIVQVLNIPQALTLEKTLAKVTDAHLNVKYLNVI